MPPVTEAELLALWRAGDDDAGAQLCRRHVQLVMRIAAAYRPRSCGVDDLVQEVFLTMFARSERYTERDGVPFEHWLSRLAVNVCRDELRSEKREPTHGTLSPDGERVLAWLASGGEEAVGDAHAAREAVEALLARLPADDRMILTLLDIEGRSTVEIAALTGWSRTLVKVRAFRARRRLRAVAERLERRDG